MKSFRPIETLEAPYPIPYNWQWVRFGQVMQSMTNGIYKQSHFYADDGILCLRMYNIKDGRINFDNGKRIRISSEELEMYRLARGDLLVNRVNSKELVGKAAPIPECHEPLIFESKNIRVRLMETDVLPRYSNLLFQTTFYRAILEGHSKQTCGQATVSQPQLAELPLPLAPIAEQDRIIAKVDELMALCDRLEATTRDRENHRDRLAAAFHHYLNNGADAVGLRNFANFYITHLPTITNRPDEIPDLRKTILGLAIRGQLLPQDSTDERASELLKRIQAKKETLAKDGRIKSPVSLPAISAQSVPFPLPSGWLWVRFGELVEEADAGWSPKSEDFPKSGDNWGVLKVSAVSWDRFLPEENKQLFPGVVPPISAQVHAGDFLISRANTSELVAKSVVVEGEPQNLILSDKIVRLQTSEDCDKKFLSMVNNHAPYARAYYAEEASGTSFSMKNVSRAVIYGLAIPLPPLAEQRRIMAKVNELMALCDRLEAQLAAAQDETSRLLESVLYHSLG